MWGVLTPAIDLWSFGSPGGLPSPNFGSVSFILTLSQSRVAIGRWWLPSSPGRGESCESVFVHGESVHQKCSNYALSNLLSSLCRSVWVIDLLVTLPSPHLGAPTRPSTPQSFVSQGARPNSFYFPCFHLWTCSWVH